MPFSITFTWKNKTWTGDVAPRYIEGIMCYCLHVPGRSEVRFVSNGTKFSSVPWIGYELTNIIGRELNKHISGKMDL